jgi:hypothetical protein
MPIGHHLGFKIPFPKNFYLLIPSFYLTPHTLHPTTN